jgi:hypothetical protein
MKNFLVKVYLWTIVQGWKWIKKLHYLENVFTYLHTIHWNAWQRDENSKNRAQDIVNYSDGAHRLEILKRGLEKTDQDFITTMYNKIQLISENNIIPYPQLFSQAEQTEQKKFAKFCLKYPHPYFPLNQVSSWLNLFYEHTLLKIPESKEYVKDTTILDCGGYIADTALMFQNFFHPQKIYTFEPNTTNYQQALKTLQDNQVEDKIVPIKQGLG